MDSDRSTGYGFVREVLQALASFWRHRTVGLLAPRFGPSSNTLIQELEHYGANVIAVVTGTEPEPGASEVAHTFSTEQCGMRLDRSDFERWLRSPDASLGSWFDRIDPEGKMLLLGTVFTDVSHVCGRQVHGWRPHTWAEWEDKTLVDERLRAIGVPTPAFAVLSPRDPQAVDWTSRLDHGHGVIIASDASLGNRGDAKQLSWIRYRPQLDDVLEHLQRECCRIRIATFERGVPCSILGMVLDTGVAVFEPIEIVTLRQAKSTRLLFCGSSNRWRPTTDARRQMRQCTHRLGTALAVQVGYRGMFSLDGILTPRGFVATEVNPRHASGLGLRAGWPSFPIYLFARAIQHRMAALSDVSAADVEAAFGEVIRAYPSHSIVVPLAAEEAKPCDTNRVVEVATVEGLQTVRFRNEGDSVRLLDATPPAASGALSPTAAGLARSISGQQISAFTNDEANYQGASPGA